MTLCKRLVLAEIALLALTCFATASFIPLRAFAAQKSKPASKRAITLNGVTFKVPKGYKVADAKLAVESVLMFGKDGDAVFFAVSQNPSTDPTEIIKTALTQLYPKERQQYSWKELPPPQRVSKFESSARAEYGYNGNQLVKVVFRYISLNDKVLLVGDVGEVSRGNEARTMFDEKLEAISLSLCYVIVESIFPLTREKADPKNPPCEFVADVFTSKPPPNK